MYICISGHMYICINVSMYICTHVHAYIYIYICIYVYMHGLHASTFKSRLCFCDRPKRVKDEPTETVERSTVSRAHGGGGAGR